MQFLGRFVISNGKVVQVPKGPKTHSLLRPIGY